MTIRHWIALIGFILLSECAGLIGSAATMPSIASGWYASLAQPALTPPPWVFGPVWTLLYILMGIVAFLVWQVGWRRHAVRMALIVFLAQLIANALWSVFFFGFQSPVLAFADILVLWAGIIATIILFARLSRAAAWLLVPYLAWVSFATYLNWAIIMLNH